jgi:hypothetical protein
MRTCIDCGETKPLTPEHFEHKQTNILRFCRPCHRARRRAKYAANPEHRLQQNRQWRAANPETWRQVVSRWPSEYPDICARTAQ